MKSKIINMLSNRRLINSKWVFKNKIDGQFRAGLAARGYTQILAVYFTDNYLPVVTYVALCVILIMLLINKW